MKSTHVLSAEEYMRMMREVHRNNEIATCEREIKFQQMWIDTYRNSKSREGIECREHAEKILAEWITRLLELRSQ